MTFDAELRDLAGRAAHAHTRSDGFASLAVKSRVRRARRVYRATVAAGTMAAVVAVGAVATAVAQRWPERVPPAETLEPAPDATDAPILPSPTPDATDAPTLITDGVLVGWRDLGVDEAIFGPVAITDAVAVDGRAVAVGCDESDGDSGGFPAYFADDAATWTRASGATSAFDDQYACLDQVVSTPHGLFAAGVLGLFRSDDGTTWETVELPGYDHGWVDAVFAAGDRVTVLVGQASYAESTVAAMWTTTDGETWTPVTDGSAAVFDNGGVADVITFGDRLVAVGAQPGGEFVPTAAAWVSADGLTWERTTATGEGFADDAMVALAAADGGLVAVGWCSDTKQLCAWRSTDGTTWVPEAVPSEDLDPSVSYIQAGALTALGNDVYAVGSKDVAASETFEPRLWHRAPGGPWERIDPETVGAVPFAQVDVGGRLVGFWPGRGWPTGGAVRVLTPVE